MACFYTFSLFTFYPLSFLLFSPLFTQWTGEDRFGAWGKRPNWYLLSLNYHGGEGQSSRKFLSQSSWEQLGALWEHYCIFYPILAINFALVLVCLLRLVLPWAQSVSILILIKNNPTAGLRRRALLSSKIPSSSQLASFLLELVGPGPLTQFPV